jgi:hypothetical protein
MMYSIHKQFGQWLEAKLMSTPQPGRRRPQYNTNLLTTQIVLKILGIDNGKR